MANAGSIRAGRAFVELWADTSKLDAALKNVGKKFEAFGTMVAGWGAQMARIGALIVAPLVATSKLAGKMGDDYYNMSKRTGISVETLSALDYAASQTGTSLESLETGIKNMQKGLVNAAGGSAEARDALQALGPSIEQLRGLSPDEQFMTIAAALSRIESPALRAALAMKIFGKSGTDLLPLLNEGPAGIRQLIERARELGLVMSTADARAANAFNDKLTELWKVVKRLGFDIGSVLLPALTSIANITEKVIATTRAWISTHKDVVVMALAMGSALIAAGVALFVFGKAIAWAAGVLLAVRAAMAAMWAVFAAVGGAISTVFSSPLLAAIAIVVALGGAFVWLSGAGGKAVAWLGERFRELSAFAVEAFHGIADAMLAGDVVLAAKILWTSLKIAWETGVNWLENVWGEFKLGFIKAAYSMVFGAQAAFEILTHWLTLAWVNTIAALKTAWSEFSYWYSMAVEGLANWIAVNLMGADQDYVDKQSQANITDIENQRASQQTNIEADRKQQISTEQKDHEDKMAEIGAAYDAEIEKAQADFDRKMKEGAEELSKLWDEFNAQVAQAKKERQMKESQLDSSAPPGAPDIPDFVPGINAARQATFGTFSAAAAQAAGAVGGGSVLEIAAKETAKNTAAIKEGVDDVRGAIENGGMAFS